jgi:hypothetical protein
MTFGANDREKETDRLLAAGKHRLQLLRAGLKPVKERALRHQGIDEERVTAPSTIS